MMNSFDRESNETKFNAIYRGEVIDTQDPIKAGRVRVRVFSVFDDISDAALPWAIMADSFMGGQAGFGGFFVPDVGSHVWVFFETGDPEQPVYFAGAPARPHFPPEKNTDYPTNHVYKTRVGHLVEINDGGNYIHIQHSSGTEMTMHPNGDVTINCADITTNCNNATVNCDTSTVNSTTSTVNASSQIDLSTPLVAISTDVTIGGNLAVTGPMTTQGSITATGEVTGNGVELSTHTHSGVVSGGSNTGQPN